MGRYIAFLRGVNVSGQKRIKMEDLRMAFAGAGFSIVETFIQSGNVLFNTGEKDTLAIIDQIEWLIANSFGFTTDVIVRNQKEIESVLNALQICKLNSGEAEKYYITFLKEYSSKPIELPLFSKNRDVEIIHHSNGDFISISREFKGAFGFPNAFIEKYTGIAATTRNPETTRKILELLSKE